jgi:uncharacterized protein YndB with AHSA1/START domain
MNDGLIERNGDLIALRFERLLHHPPPEVWAALTDPDQEAWFSGNVEIDLRVGGRYVTHHETGDTVVDRIVRLDPPRLLEHTFWEHINPDSTVSYELSDQDGGCLLVLTHRLSRADLEKAAQLYQWVGNPFSLVPRSAAGWHRLLDQLDAHLDGAEYAGTAEEMAVVLERYSAQAGSLEADGRD